MTASRSVTAAFAAAFFAAAVPAAAQSLRRGECLLEVHGRSYLDGPCSMRLFPGGGFEIGSNRRGGSFATVDIDPAAGTAPGGGFEIGSNRRGGSFATVDIDPAAGTAEGFWNGVERESHAHESLGTVVRQGGCWQNNRAVVCAWRPGTRPR